MFLNKRVLFIGLLLVFLVVPTVHAADNEEPHQSGFLQNDLPHAINDKLLGGDSLIAAQMLLAAAVLVGTALPLAMGGLPQLGVVVVLVVEIGFLTALGWVNPIILLVIGLLVAALWSSKVAGWITGEDKK